MSNFIAPARHPDTGVIENAEWLDDHFGRHVYGVRFSDGQVFHESQVESIGLSLAEFVDASPPAAKFTPYHEWGRDGSLRVYIKDGRSYLEQLTPTIDVMRDADTGEVIGLWVRCIERVKKEG